MEITVYIFYGICSACNFFLICCDPIGFTNIPRKNLPIVARPFSSIMTGEGSGYVSLLRDLPLGCLCDHFLLHLQRTFNKSSEPCDSIVPEIIDTELAITSCFYAHFFSNVGHNVFKVIL